RQRPGPLLNAHPVACTPHPGPRRGGAVPSITGPPARREWPGVGRRAGYPSPQRGRRIHSTTTLIRPMAAAATPRRAAVTRPSVDSLGFAGGGGTEETSAPGAPRPLTPRSSPGLVPQVMLDIVAPFQGCRDRGQHRPGGESPGLFAAPRGADGEPRARRWRRSDSGASGSVSGHSARDPMELVAEPALDCDARVVEDLHNGREREAGDQPILLAPGLCRDECGEEVGLVFGQIVSEELLAARREEEAESSPRFRDPHRTH